MSGAAANSSGASPSTPPPEPAAAGGGPAGAPPTAATAAPLGRAAKLALAAVAICALAALFWPRGEGDAPGGFLLDAAGRPAPLGSRLAPVTLVHFWATWCPPCIEETPAIQRLAADLSGHPDFAVLMIAVADSNERVQSFLGSRRADMALFDPRWDVAHRYGTRQLPETYLVVGGRVVRKFVGMTNWDDAEVRRGILARLSEGAGAPAGERRRGG
jgi:cytochrome c biogenesis protein CcmG/thiol:disulfide interchange protein DsbE